MFEKIIEEVKNANSIYVSGHINPDGDSIGSTFAVYLALKKMGKDVKPILTKYSKTFSFLPFINEADIMLDFMAEVRDRLGYTAKTCMQIRF